MINICKIALSNIKIKTLIHYIFESILNKLLINQKTRAHAQYIYIYIYIERERERENYHVYIFMQSIYYCRCIMNKLSYLLCL